jgi:hypothetical protein
MPVPPAASAAIFSFLMVSLMTRTAILAVSLVMGAWLLFDGFRALATGHYTTPASGPYAGQLGPWSRLVARAIAP